MFKAVILDWDGTLADTIVEKERFWASFLRGNIERLVKGERMETPVNESMNAFLWTAILHHNWHSAKTIREVTNKEQKVAVLGAFYVNSIYSVVGVKIIEYWGVE